MSNDLKWQPYSISKLEKSAIKGQRSCVLWFTGLPSSGKSTIANLVDLNLHRWGRHVAVLDGDNVRLGLNSDLGFNKQDRLENIRRIAEVAKLMVDSGLIVCSAFISPFIEQRKWARSLFSPGEFIEIHVDVTLEVAEHRDPKGLYGKARLGLIKDFTGISSPYEPPVAPEIHIKGQSELAAARIVVEYLRSHGKI